jgi:vacuolar protein sorting-associated protein VTA1
MVRATIRKFVVAGQFIEVLRCFENGMTDEVSYIHDPSMPIADQKMEQKLQYARWKAADGAKALREGREPVSGPRKLSRPCLWPS